MHMRINFYKQGIPQFFPKLRSSRICWKNFRNNDWVKNQELFRNFDAISGHNWYKNDFPDRNTLIEQSLTLIERLTRSNS